MLIGNLDIVNRQEVAGWAQDDAQPDVPVSLLVIVDDDLLGRILANRYRADLEQAGIGSGRHSFEFQLPKSLPPFERHVLKVCRESDGIDLAQSPVVLEPAKVFDAATQDALADIIRRCGSDHDIAAKVDFLMNEVDGLLQNLADRDSGRADRNRYRHLLQRWRKLPSDAAAAESLAAADISRPAQRALVIDDRIPRSDRDAGSLAILSHIQSLQRLGYEVVFAPTVELVVPDESHSALDSIGVTVCRAPYYGSIEEILRRQAGGFDIVYMHRVSNAVKYGEIVRHHNPKARQIYSVADLHHIRIARQAIAEDRPELVARSQWLRFAEFVAAVSADVVITHSAREADELAKQIPASKIHTVLWSTTPKPTRLPFAKRRGIAFIGGYSHEPNLDAARSLIREIMPSVRKQNPNIECLLVGHDLPEQLRQLCGDGVVAVGYVEDLAEIFDRVRLTVAPLTYGAGIKGKVIESLAAGVPCICTPVAAEGLDFPPALEGCVAEGVERFAALICQMHDDEAANDTYSRAALRYIGDVFSPESLNSAMRRALGAAPFKGSSGELKSTTKSR